MRSRKVIGGIIGVLMFICTVLLGTYAVYSWKSGNTDVTFSGSLSSSVGGTKN